MLDFLSLAHLREDLGHLLGPVRRDQDGDGLPHRLLDGVPVEPLGRPVPAGDDALEGLAENSVVGGLDDGREPGALLLGPLAFGDVLYHAYKVLGGGPSVAHQGYRQVDPDDGALLFYVALLHRVRLYLPSEQPAHLLEVRLEIVRVGYVLEGHREELFTGV